MVPLLFYIFATIAVIASLAVIFLRNPVTCALSLVVSFVAVAGVFILLHAPFLGIMQILIYAGAIMVLFLYVTMLLNIRGGGTKVSYERASQIGAITLLPVLVFGLTRSIHYPDLPAAILPDDFGSIMSVADLLLSHYALLFELVSLPLLAAIIGAVLLSTLRRKDAL